MALTNSQSSGKLEALFSELLAQADLSTIPAEKFAERLDSEVADFLFEKYLSADINTRKEILQVFQAFIKKKRNLPNDLLLKILKFVSVSEFSLFENFKTILQCLDENEIKPLTGFLTSTSDPNLHSLLQEVIDNTGIIDKLIEKWKGSSYPQKITLLAEFMPLQHPKIYKYLIDALSDVSPTDDRKLLQARMAPLLENIHDPKFIDFAATHLVDLEPGTWAPIFRTMQIHRKTFFEKIFKDIDSKTETFRWRVALVLDEIVNPYSYPFIFPMLLDKSKRVPPLAKSIIEKIIKQFSSSVGNRKSGSDEKLAEVETFSYYSTPIADFLSKNDPKQFSFLGEALLRLGGFNEPFLIENLHQIVSTAHDSIKTYLRTITPETRRNLLIKAWCSNNPNVRDAATTIMKNCKEDYAGEAFDTLLTEFPNIIPPDYRKDAFKLAFISRPKEVLYRALQHQDVKIRNEVLKIIGDNCGFDALPVLLSRKSDPEAIVRSTLIDILQSPMFSSRDSIEAITDFLLDQDPGVVLKAIGVVRAIDHPSTLVKLNQLLIHATLPAIKSSALSAISTLTRKKLFSNFEAMGSDSRFSIVASLVKLDPMFISDMIRDFSSDDVVKRRMAARILALLWNNVPLEKGIQLEDGIQSADPFLRSIFVKILARIGKTPELNMLFQLIHDEDLRVRANAIEAIAMAKENIDPTFLNQLPQFLSDQNHRIRANTIISLYRFSFLQPDPYLTEMLRQPNKNMQLGAVYAIGEIPEVRFIPVLLNFLRNSDADFRRNSVKSLGKYQNNYLAMESIRKLRFDPDEGVRKMVSDFLAKMERNQGQ
ncbi:MAG: HEAT repeat domain-containing protein [Candidatus Riflebacteria bacterium]|nr:HEAT repeat domain-containing protein [Candidatus Riflebacteria bacterium]